MNAPTPVYPDASERILSRGLANYWFPICPSSWVGEQPLSLRRLGRKLVLWRDSAGVVRVMENHCPHRGAALSMGVVLGDRIACAYHGVEVRCDGTVTRVPGSPGCKLEGSRATRIYPAREAQGAVFVYNAAEPHCDDPPALVLPEQLTSDDWSSFLCYVEWACDYRYVMENVMDPMHGAYLHRQSHSMAEGDFSAEFQIRDTDKGFIFEKKGQRNINFDWTEWLDTGIHLMRLEIPYPKTGGPGGNFTIVGGYVPISPRAAGIFFWRCRKVSGWQRSAWRFLYRNRLEARHFHVLEQDRVAMENMEPDANQREHLYQHDMGIVRLRRTLRNARAATNRS